MHIHDEEPQEWGPSLNMKFTYASHKPFTQSLKEVLYNIFDPPAFSLQLITQGQWIFHFRYHVGNQKISDFVAFQFWDV